MDPRQPNDLQATLSYTEQVQWHHVHSLPRLETHRDICVTGSFTFIWRYLRPQDIKNVLIAAPWFPIGVLNSRDGACIRRPSLK